EKSDYRSGDSINNYTSKHDEGDPFLGDILEEPPIVRNALRRLGGDIFSSSEEDSWELSEGIEEEGEDPLRRKKKKSKGGKHEESTTSGSAANVGKLAPTDENFFLHYVERDEHVYSQLGEVLKDEDICAEVVTHHLIASVKNDKNGGTPNHPKVSSDSSVSFSDIFLSCLTTDGFLTTKDQGLPGRKKYQKTVKCITRTNESFLMETHAMMSHIEQEIQAWKMLNALLCKDEFITQNDFSCSMPWKCNGSYSLEKKDMNLSFESMLPKGLSEFSKNDPTALLEYAIEFERCKIENVLRMCYFFSRGERNQFLSRNIREVAFCYFLNPGEPEFLLQVCGLKNSSIVPSIIVSRLRQNDVDRLAKIVDEMTVYSVIEEFAEFNGFVIRDKNIASHNHAKHLFYSRCTPPTSPLHESIPAQPDHIVHHKHVISHTEVHSLIQHLYRVSIGGALNAHLTQTLDSSPFGLGDAENEFSSEQDEKEEENKDGSLSYSIFSSRSTLRRMYKHEGTYRFLSPDVSVPWKSPRGCVRVVRVILFRCINYFMKEISHTIDVKSFFFNSWMTIKLCNNLTFIQLHNIREEIIARTQHNAEENQSGVDEEPEPKKKSPHIPTHEEIASLFSSSQSVEFEDLYSGSHSQSMTSESTDDNDDDDDEIEEREKIYPFSPDFTTFMRTRAENCFMNFYFRCPVVLQCMTGCFLWNPSTCTTKECLGSDSLLGIHTWLFEMTQHISSFLIPELLIQNAFYLESGTSQTWITTNQSFLLDDNDVETMTNLYASMRNTYQDSTYIDKGMQYKYLLMLFSNMPSFGNRGMYSTMVEHLCTFVILMDAMMFPHILETFSIHVQGSPSPKEDVTRDEEKNPSSTASHRAQRRASVPVDSAIHYVEQTLIQSAQCDGKECDDDDEIESVSMYYPKTYT
ncbi:MAG: hypothetical protein ACTSUE_20040, partial [Promethearchaeota archaeon]